MINMTTDTTTEHLKQTVESCQQTDTCNKESLLHKAHTHTHICKITRNAA